MKTDAAVRKEILKQISYIAVSYAESLDADNSHEDRERWRREFTSQVYNLVDAIMLTLELAEESLDHLLGCVVVGMDLQDDDSSQFN